MREKDTVGYWRQHCKCVRRKVAKLEVQNKAMYEALKACNVYMTEKGISHEYPIMKNMRVALALVKEEE